MKVVSSKRGSTRERVDIQADMNGSSARWRAEWVPDHEMPSRMRDAGSRLVLSSAFGGARHIELWLTELEAFAIFSAVSNAIVAAEAKRLSGRNET